MKEWYSMFLISFCKTFYTLILCFFISFGFTFLYVELRYEAIDVRLMAALIMWIPVTIGYVVGKDIIMDIKHKNKQS